MLAPLLALSWRTVKHSS